jgi:hypothetical protein
VRAPALFLSLLLIPATAGAQDYLNCRFAPGWEQSGAIRQYVSGNLYDYKDGGAEGYLAYGFVRMTGIDCKSGANTLQIDVSEIRHLLRQSRSRATRRPHRHGRPGSAPERQLRQG